MYPVQCTKFLIHSYNNSVVIIHFPWIICFSLILFGHVKISSLKEQIEVQVINSYMFQYYKKKKKKKGWRWILRRYYAFLFSLMDFCSVFLFIFNFFHEVRLKLETFFFSLPKWLLLWMPVYVCEWPCERDLKTNYGNELIRTKLTWILQNLLILSIPKYIYPKYFQYKLSVNPKWLSHLY